MKKVVRPWGNFKEFVKNKKCTVKILEVKPRQVLSLQVHKKRDELWYFLDKALVQIGDEVKKVKSGESVKIVHGKMHRVMAGWRKIRFLEVSYGKFSERDEMRLYDPYGRK
ncbi:MAG: mannose-6-phosphate isomerase [Nanoarchaeota archaeon]|nr:mannose-6-phosphate isomerase [Nanoarchaeota archaeon]